MNFIKKNIFVLVFLFVVGVGGVFALNTYLTGFQINNGNTTIDTFSYDTVAVSAGEKYRIVNSTSNSYFLPTKTLEEWESFKNNKPSGVTVQFLKTYSAPKYSGYRVLNNVASATRYCTTQGYTGLVSNSAANLGAITYYYSYVSPS
ncbi:hypothetical protein LDC_2665 [sediment metagenome]|uniref:Uncharacterized protein n=1 Tax=sediment metagenome TaxID=749907 RepID=D9PM87_9ZZZZ